MLCKMHKLPALARFSYRERLNNFIRFNQFAEVCLHYNRFIDVMQMILQKNKKRKCTIENMMNPKKIMTKIVGKNCEQDTDTRNILEHLLTILIKT